MSSAMNLLELGQCPVNDFLIPIKLGSIRNFSNYSVDEYRPVISAELFAILWSGRHSFTNIVVYDYPDWVYVHLNFHNPLCQEELYRMTDCEFEHFSNFFCGIDSEKKSNWKKEGF